MAKPTNKIIDSSTEEKIKEAAKKLFTQKGFNAVKTREIAAASGINLALLNYYFRSKQKLFEIVMAENLFAFKNGMSNVLNDDHDDIFVKIEKMASYYIDTLKVNPNLALFVVNAIHDNQHDIFDDKLDPLQKSRNNFAKQFMKSIEEGKITPINPIHILSNIIGLIVMPFLAKPMMLKRLKISDKEFTSAMEERKKLIPIWIKAMLKIN